MPQTHNARREEPFFRVTATGDDFEKALKYAVREDARSLIDLKLAVRACVLSLKVDGMECEQALLTMKAFVRDVCGRHRRRGSHEMQHSEVLMDKIVAWSISEFYSNC